MVRIQPLASIHKQTMTTPPFYYCTTSIWADTGDNPTHGGKPMFAEGVVYEAKRVGNRIYFLNEFDEFVAVNYHCDYFEQIKVKTTLVSPQE